MNPCGFLPLLLVLGLLECGQGQDEGQTKACDLPEHSASEATTLVTYDKRNVQRCPAPPTSQVCPHAKTIYRTIDGSCNNIEHPDWGKANTPPKRLLKNHYDDGQGHPRTRARDGSPLTSPREISRAVAVDQSSLSPQLTVMHMAFGQYIDHDLAGVVVTKLNGSLIVCCDDNINPDLRLENGGPCFPIMINCTDRFFTKTCMEFTRSLEACESDGKTMAPREQVNGITSFIDASVVYGSSDEFLTKFKLDDGSLQVTEKNFLPDSGKPNCKIVDPTLDHCQAAGDGRVNVFLGLGMLHTVFHREHNRLTSELRRLTNNSWDSEKYFQEARKINAALHQVVTYKEYLPSVLPDCIMREYRLTVPTESCGKNTYVYDPHINPQMSNAFGTAAFRFGHSQIQRKVQVGNHTTVALEDTLMRPHLLLKHGVEDVVTGMTGARAEMVDRGFVTAITDRLFENNATNRDGLDLVALNCQRGRDHGLPPYNDYRELCGLDRITTFDHPDLSPSSELASVYKHVDDIDLFIGGVAERPLPGGLVGPTFACILGRQFHDVKYGDRFWYENSNTPEGFTHAQLQEIQKMTLSGILCQNSNLQEIQRNSLFHSSDSCNPTNPVMPCDTQPKLDLRHWVNI